MSTQENLAATPAESAADAVTAVIQSDANAPSAAADAVSSSEPASSSRREFLRKAAVAGAGFAVASASLTGGVAGASEGEPGGEVEDHASGTEATKGVGAKSGGDPLAGLPQRTLLDGGGMLQAGVTPETFEAWKAELRRGKRLHPRRAALLHLLVGEYELATNEEPEKALHHFRAAKLAAPAAGDLLHGWACFDEAFGLYMNSQYKDSAQAFEALLSRGGLHPESFPHNLAVFRMRHAGICAAEHEHRASLGIPRPLKLDPVCGVAGLAISLKALGVRGGDKKTVLACTRVTGRGSSAKDLVDACAKLSERLGVPLSGRALTADEQGLKGLPKPLIAHVEGDHFVTVVKADDKGVSYVCTDCGPWPGGRIDLTWEQWRALAPDAYVCVTRKGGEPDRVLAAVLDGEGAVPPAEAAAGTGRVPGILVAMNPFRAGQRLGNLVELSAMYRQVQGHIAAIPVGVTQTVECGFTGTVPPCPPNTCCPKGSGGPAGGGGAGGSGPSGFGPSAGDPVNLATFEEEYEPAPDLVVYNPIGPAVSWQRSYRSLRGKDPYYAYADYGMGWTHNYNFLVVDPTPGTGALPSDPTAVPQANSRSIPVTGNQAPSGSAFWEVLYNGQVIASGGAYAPSDGWQVYGEGDPSMPFATLMVRAPFPSTLGAGYVARVRNFAGGTYSAPFKVAAPLEQPASGTKHLVFPNGSQVSFTTSAVASASLPSVACGTPPGQPMHIRMLWNPTTEMCDYEVLNADGSRMRFGCARVEGGPVLYQPTRLEDRVGNAIAFRYQTMNIGGTGQTQNPRLVGIDAVAAGGATTTLLSIARTFLGPSMGYITSISDCYGRSVYYKNSWHASSGVVYYSPQGQFELDEVSQIVPTGTSNPPMRYQYGYPLVTNGHNQGVPMLGTITVPSPTGTGTATATINYHSGTGFVTSIVDANGNRKEFTPVDASGNPAPYSSSSRTRVTVKDPQGNTVYSYTSTYNSGMSQTGTTDGAGNATVTEVYGSAINPLRPTSVKDGENRQWQYTWDQYGNMLTATSPRGTVTTFSYDYSHFPLGRLLSEQEGGKAPKVYTYFEPSGLVQTITAPAPGVTGSGATVYAQYTYDLLGNVLTIDEPGNNTSARVTKTFNYTSDGTYSQAAATRQFLTVTSSAGNVEHFRYDQRGNRVRYVDASGNEIDYAYNIADQAMQYHHPATGQTGAGRAYTAAVRLYNGGPLQSLLHYDEAGNLFRQEGFTYGAEGELLQKTGSTESVAFGYDTLYRVVSVTDGNGNATSFGFNPAGYLASVTYPGGGGTVQFPSYDTSGNALQRVDGNGMVTNYVYNDAEGRLTDTQYPSSPGNNVHLSYDLYGRKSGMTDATGASTYTYDDQDNRISDVTTYAGLPSLTLTYGFHPDGSRSSLTTPAGTFTYSYDLAQRLTALQNPFGQVFVWSYQPNGSFTGQQLGNGITAEYTCDSRGRTIAVQHRVGTGTLLAEFGGVTYDAVGSPVGLVANMPCAPSFSGTTTYTYDAKNRLTSETSTRNGGSSLAFGYDSAGNPTTFRGAMRTYDSSNRMTNSGYSYDGNGNPITYKAVQASFDIESRLSAYSGVTYGYRGDGKLAFRETAVGRIYYLYDGHTPIIGVNAAGGVEIVRTIGVFGLLASRSGGTDSFYSFDPFGNTAVRSALSGQVLSASAFDAFGVRASTDNNQDPLDCHNAQWGYAIDHVSGLQPLTFRFYDPATGRFLTRDPIGHNGGINLYSYVRNRVPMLSDPIGLKPGFNGPGYGTYCGPWNAGPGPEEDGLDAACHQHDICTSPYKMCWAEPGKSSKCDMQLCAAALSELFSGCSSSSTPYQCRIAAALIAEHMCNPNLGATPFYPLLNGPGLPTVYWPINWAL